ncbi:MAG: hypothetical protein ACU841_03230 [Gammaproteobacteria bacterium]
MNRFHYHKIYYGSILAGFFLLILFPAEVIGFLFDVLHSLFDFIIDFLHHLFEILFELGHLLFELIESSLDHLVEHLFHTDLHTTQTIVFYLMLIPGLYIGYRVLRISIVVCRRWANALLHACTDYKNLTVAYWHDVDSLDKIKWIAILGAGLYLIFSVSF